MKNISVETYKMIKMMLSDVSLGSASCLKPTDMYSSMTYDKENQLVLSFEDLE